MFIKRIITLCLILAAAMSLSASAFAAEELPFEEYGNFTEVNDVDELRQRAEWFYRTFIADPDKLRSGADSFSVEEIMNDIRIMNGEFMRSGENISYSEFDLINAANDLHTIANYDSLTKYGTQIFFTPTAPLFVDGSSAQKDAIIIDRAMEKIVAAIRAEDNTAFTAAVQEWGKIIIDIFSKDDLAGDCTSVYQVGPAEGFALYHAMSSKYASTVFKYSEAQGLTVMVQNESIQKIVDRLNNEPVESDFAAAGQLEGDASGGVSLPENLYLLAKDYFNSRYYRETEAG